jgi:hypothetical protein
VKVGRPKGSKNKRSLAADLLDEVTQQDEEFVRKDNAKVLGVANGESTKTKTTSQRMSGSRA